MKGMTTCKVCGRDFALMIEEHYIVRNSKVTGVLPALNGTEESGLFDAFDCPFCGSQNIMQERKRPLEEDDNLHDGCEGCVHQEKDEDEYPCNDCKNNHKDFYEEEKENE